VLITGAAGLIGTILRERLAATYAIRAVDRNTAPGIAPVVMTDLGLAIPAFVGVDTVLDLAADAKTSIGWHEVCANNIPATVNALEASRQAGVRRYVFMSSNHVTGAYELDQPYARIVAGRHGGLDPAAIPQITAQSPVRPDGPYAVGKLAGEAAARYYAETFDLSAVCLRIGTVNSADRPIEPRHRATLLTHDDLVRLVERAIEAPDSVRYGVFYGVSANTWRFWDIEDARESIGYSPADNADDR